MYLNLTWPTTFIRPERLNFKQKLPPKCLPSQDEEDIGVLVDRKIFKFPGHQDLNILTLCGLKVWIVVWQLKFRPCHLTAVQNCKVRLNIALL
ncbi:hypothetical protein AVEN_147706-1 [Araneus ventricosus]|uniref:Uncharacterized protein n=1 Tax=Araneus ventricosus TaxID=182803 RepID=A0A4Y2PR17_ARAVE|nr:hypothetical protein AVEN_147706-1 [Araneus ventricosus]